MSDEVIYMPEHGGRKAVMEVSFRAEPFCKCIFDTEGPALEMPFMLDANIPIDISCLFKFNISGSGDISVYNFGKTDCKAWSECKKCNAVYERQIAYVYVKRSDNY